MAGQSLEGTVGRKPCPPPVSWAFRGQLCMEHCQVRPQGQEPLAETAVTCRPFLELESCWTWSCRSPLGARTPRPRKGPGVEKTHRSEPRTPAATWGISLKVGEQHCTPGLIPSTNGGSPNPGKEELDPVCAFIIMT